MSSEQRPYFYEPELKNTLTTFVLNENSSRHCIQVLRMQQNDEIELTDGNGLLATAKITLAHKKHCQTHILNLERTDPPAAGICLGISPTKNISRIEWLLEKITEIGITEIWLMDCDRTERSVVRWDRLNQILISAMLQSRQVFLPKLSNLLKFNDIIQQNNYTNKWIAHCLPDEEKVLLGSDQPDQSQIVLIGPEGDFSQEEIDQALKNKFRPVTLGPTRLRTETAGLVATVLLNYSILNTYFK